MQLTATIQAQTPHAVALVIAQICGASNVTVDGSSISYAGTARQFAEVTSTLARQGFSLKRGA